MKNTEVIKSGSDELLWAFFRGTAGCYVCYGLDWPAGQMGHIAARPHLWHRNTQEPLPGLSLGSRVMRPGLNNPCGPAGRKNKSRMQGAAGALPRIIAPCWPVYPEPWWTANIQCLPFYRIYHSQASKTLKLFRSSLQPQRVCNT